MEIKTYESRGKYFGGIVDLSADKTGLEDPRYVCGQTVNDMHVSCSRVGR
jgi:hypothetical protein